MTIDFIVLVLMTLGALYTVMCRSLLKATIGLALTSIAITILIFRLNAWIAAVFELSVCAGLMTVIFVSAISLTRPLTNTEVTTLSKNRMKRFWYLPLIMAIAGIAMFTFVKIPNNIMPIQAIKLPDARTVLWNLRQIDLFGQIIIIIVGALGVVVLFEERKKDEW